MRCVSDAVMTDAKIIHFVLVAVPTNDVAFNTDTTLMHSSGGIQYGVTG